LKTIKIIIFAILGLSIIFAAGYFGFRSTAIEEPTAVPVPETIAVSPCDVVQSISAPGKLVNFNATIVNMPVEGKLSQVLVKPGDQVTAGQALAQLDEMAKSEATLKVLEAKEALETAENNRLALDYPRATDEYIRKLEEEIDVQRQNVILLEDIYDDAQTTTAKSEALTNLSSAKQNLDEMNARLNWYKGKPTQDDIDQADSKLALAQAQYAAATAIRSDYEINSPISGIVVEVYALTGEQYKADQNLFKIIDPQSLEVQANITEEDYPLITPGMQAEIFLDARPDLTLSGKVDRIVPIRISDSSALYNIYIKLDEVPDGLADGMTIDSSITIQNRANVLCLPRSIVRTSGEGNAMLQVWTGTEIIDKEVEIGLRGDTYVEILSGLAEGEQVVIR
jgi:membrane fusion protein, macrolide-specific efflux system